MKMNLSGMKKLNVLRYGEHPRPSRDWLVLLCVCCVLLAGSILVNLWYFAKVTGGENIGTETTPNASFIQLEPVTALFEKRNAERDRYLSEYRFVDPSGGRGTVE